MNIYTIGVIVSVIVYIFVGNYAGSRVKDLDDYYVSGRNATTLLITGTLFASMLSTNGFMGDTGFAYEGHITLMIIINAICAGGYILGPLFFGRYIRRMEVHTMPQYFGDRFNSRKVRIFAGLTTIISLTAYLLAVIQGTGILMGQLTGFSYELCLLISWICFTSFTFYSGSSGVVLTDTLMCIIFLISTILAGPFIFGKVGGVMNVIPNMLKDPTINNQMMSYHGILGSSGGYATAFDAISYAVTMGLVWLITVSVSPWQAGRNLMAENEHVTFRSGSLAVILTIGFLSFLYFLGFSINIINPNVVPTENVIIWACLNIVPPIIGVLVLTGVMAAGLSSASTFLSVVGFSLTNDILDREFEDENKQLWFTRWVMLGVGLISLVLAFIVPPNIRVISWFASTIIAASWGPVAFMSVWSKKLTAKGALYGMVAGFFGQLLATAIGEFTPLALKNLFHPFFIGIYCSLIAIYIGNKTSVKSDEEIDYQKQMHIIPESEQDPDLYRTDRRYAVALIIGGVIITIVGLLVWALPYMEGL